MDEGYKVLVAAISAVAVIWFFMAYLLPLLAPAPQAKDVMREALETAQAAQGKLVARDIAFKNGYALPAAALDTATRSVNFRCTDVVQCCLQQRISSGCKVAIDDRTLIAQQETSLPVSFRCDYEENIYLCSAYFGRDPAQLEITDFRAPREIEVGRDNAVLSFKAHNAGKTKASDVIATAKVYKVTLVNGKEMEALHSGPVSRSADEIAPDAEAAFSIPLEVREAGSYRISLEVRGAEAGKAGQEFDLKATGGATESKCRATVKGQTRTQDTQCLQEFRCEDCAYDYECKLAWEPKLGEENITDWSASGVWAKAEPETCA